MVLSAGATSDSRGRFGSLRDSNVLPHKTNTIMLEMFFVFFSRDAVWLMILELFEMHYALKRGRFSLLCLLLLFDGKNQLRANT